jgi:hypothetical protein
MFKKDFFVDERATDVNSDETRGQCLQIRKKAPMENVLCCR